GVHRTAPEIGVDDARALAPLGDRGDHQRLPDAGVAAGVDASLVGAVGHLGLDVAAVVEGDAGLLQQARVLGVLEADGDEHEVGLQDELAAGHWRQVPRRAAGHLTRVDVADAAVLAPEAGHLGPPPPLAALVQGVGGRGALGRQRPRRARIAVAVTQLGVDVQHDDAPRALAMGVGDAVHSGVPAADDDHLLAGGGDLGIRTPSALRRP